MHRHFIFLLLLCAALNTSAAPTTDPAVVDLNTPREFPVINNLEEWKTRAQTIREQILVSAGLWPMPEKTPLNAKIFGKVVRDSYSVEKVYFQTYPGFYLAGNLYRPLGHGEGPFPAILSPHGHWENGRLADNKDCSIPGRCINFAEQGMIAFSYDMVGYNDTHFADTRADAPFYKVHRDFETNNPTALLWSVSLMGLQTWNSIRALDFLTSLPDVDAKRLACTGESGGGTQTFLLGAIDDRLAVQAPVVMVSHTMQGGCLCENMPGLRVEFSNVEIAAAAAPRPQIMVGASGDWTKTMLTFEGPNVQHIYDLFRAPENLRYVRFDFQHNYNQTSREAVYQWFDKILLSQPDAPVKEAAFKKEPDEDLRVFRDSKLPSDAITQQELVKNLIKMHRAQLEALQPKDKESLDHYKEVIGPALERTLHVDYSKPHLKLGESTFKFFIKKDASHPAYVVSQIALPYSGETNLLTICFFSSMDTNSPVRYTTVVLINEKGAAAFTDTSGMAKGLALELLKKNYDLAILDNIPPIPHDNQTSIFFNTYNRTWLQRIVRDIAATPTVVEGEAWNLNAAYVPRVVLCGTDHAGLWTMLAAPAIGHGPSGTPTISLIADCDGLDVSDDASLLAPDLFCPGLRNIDTFNGALMMGAPHPLLLHNTAGKFPSDRLKSTYKMLDASNKFSEEKAKLSDDQIVEWISKLK